MQEPLIQLKEIIWEITTNCNNGCNYCGSKDILNNDAPNRIQTICDEIAEYVATVEGTVSIDISGGDPLSCFYADHQYIIDVMPENVRLKILVNPLSFSKVEMSSWINILKMYYWVGISVNTIEELNALKYYWHMFKANEVNVTIISNFSRDNIWHYDDIESFVIGDHPIDEDQLTWQIQYTMGDNSTAIYTNSDALSMFFNKITNSFNNGRKLVIADNMNEGECSAGKYSLGILQNGDVVACLSMRSWGTPESMGNILDTKLSTIWENNFGYFRTQSFKCCKDVCNAPYCAETKSRSMMDMLTNPRVPNPKPKPFTPLPGMTCVYGVTTNPLYPGNVFVYGVATDGPILNK
jgi:sulfatase maturation enzyme AslB (radical SAM superfamily)